jgi:hypothetical protein
MARNIKARDAVPKAEAPAVITPLHVKDRNFVAEVEDGPRTRRVLAGAKAWRKLTPLEAAYAKGQLAGGVPTHSALMRFEAGKRYAGIFAGAETQGRDSTQMIAVSKSGGGLGLGQSQRMALRALAAMEAKLGERDRRIIRMACGEGFAPVEAVRAACGDDYKHTTAARFREALDALIEAWEKRA